MASLLLLLLLQRNSGSAIAFLTLFLMVAISILFYLKSRRRWNPPLPPGPLGLPILGCLPFVDPDFHRYFAGLAQKYGPILSLRIGTKLCVVLSSPAVAQEALKDNDIIFGSHDPPSVIRRTMLCGNDLLWAPDGPLWRILRKVSVQHLLSARSIEALRPLRRREMRRTIGKLRAGAGQPVEVPEFLYSTAMNVMTSLIWGVTLDGDDDLDHTKRELLRVVNGVLQLQGEPNISDFIPALEVLDLQGLVKKMKQHLRDYEELMKRVMEKEKKKTTTMASEEDKAGENKRNTIYEVMVEMVERGDPHTPLNMEHVTALLLDLLSAGMDTTVSTTHWLLAELLRHPDMLRKAQEELDGAADRDRVVEESDLNRLTFLDAIVKETFRLHPPVPLLAPYQVSSPCIIGGYTIPPEAKVIINVWAIQRDPSVWKEEPLEFKPERFLTSAAAINDGKKYDYSGRNFSFFPFGAGRRICVGISFGERMVLYMLATLLHSFDWKPAPDGGKEGDDQEIDMEEKFGMVMKKAKPLRVILRPRLEKPELYM